MFSNGPPKCSLSPGFNFETWSLSVALSTYIFVLKQVTTFKCLFYMKEIRAYSVRAIVQRTNCDVYSKTKSVNHPHRVKFS